MATWRFSGILTQSPQFGERPPQGAAGGSGQRGPQRRLRGPLRAASRDGGGGNAVGEGSGADSGEAAAGPAAMGSEYGSAGDRAEGRTRPVGAVGGAECGEAVASRLGGGSCPPSHARGSDVAPGRLLRGTGSRARGGQYGRSRARRCAWG